jgi:hypothetical protein
MDLKWYVYRIQCLFWLVHGLIILVIDRNDVKYVTGNGLRLQIIPMTDQSFPNLHRPGDNTRSSEALPNAANNANQESSGTQSERQSKLRDYLVIYDPELDRAKPKAGNQVVYRFNGEVKPGVSILFYHCPSGVKHC